MSAAVKISAGRIPTVDYAVVSTLQREGGWRATNYEERYVNVILGDCRVVNAVKEVHTDFGGGVPVWVQSRWFSLVGL